MELLWQHRAKASHQYRRESGTAIPRLRSAGRIQAWRAGDGEAAQPIYARYKTPAPTLGEGFRDAA
jgi:hypothetical protein